MPQQDYFLCMWCGELYQIQPLRGRKSSTLYCQPAHKEKARRGRRIRRDWTFTGCDSPHTVAHRDRGMAIAEARRDCTSEMLVCKCGGYHVVGEGEGGRSPELAAQPKVRS